MFAIDIPYIPVEEPVVVQEQVVMSGSAGAKTNYGYLLEECTEMEMNGSGLSSANIFSPTGMVSAALAQTGHSYIDKATRATMKVTVLENPHQGTLTEHYTESGNSYFAYKGPLGYEGKDFASFIVEFDGKSYKVSVNIEVINAVDESRPICDEPELIEVNPPGSWLQDNAPTLSIDFADLENGSLGQANNGSITLDTTANGYGWYIDLTPGLNEEYLPTANPYEWIAKPGSEAEGKIDMLTVLLHEAAHTLGHDHTLDSHALMASTLEPGVRRLPSPELLAELQGLAEQYVALNEAPTPLPNPLPFAGFSALWMGRLRKGEYGYLLEAVGANNDRDIQ